MILALIYALSLATTFVAWYICTLIPDGKLRGIVRATIIALLCSPGIVIGHGFAIAPTLFALYIQPSIFTLGSILLVWIITVGILLGIPTLRNDRSKWPPSANEIFIRFYAIKFVFFGILAALLMAAFDYADQRNSLWVGTLQYGIFFAGAIVNLSLCYWASRERQARPMVTPALFSAPALFVAAPTVAFLWYGSGAIGGLFASGNQRIASLVSLGVFGLLSVYSLYRIYLAATAPPHVTIGGGIAGNAAMSVLFALLGILSWRILQSNGEKKKVPSSFRN